MRVFLLWVALLGAACAHGYDVRPKMVAGSPTSEGGLAEAPLVAEPAPVTGQSAPDKPSPPAAGPRSAILVYTAHLRVAVYDTARSVEAMVALAEQLGGFPSSQSGATLTLRVPAAKFQAALAALEKLGDVLQKDLSAEDVTREYLDLELRIKNARAVRDRLEVLLAKTSKVDETLAVERELARVTQDIESMEGTLRFLKDRVSLSTITVTFAPRAKELVGKTSVQLPFDWLQRLGLGSLLHLEAP